MQRPIKYLFVTPAPWGPVNHPVKILRPDDLIKIFRLESGGFIHGMANENFDKFSKDGGLHLIRVASSINQNDRSSVLATRATAVLFYGSYYDGAPIKAVARHPGALGNAFSLNYTRDFKVKVFHSGDLIRVIPDIREELRNPDPESEIIFMPISRQGLDLDKSAIEQVKGHCGTMRLSGGSDGLEGISASEYLGNLASGTGALAASMPGADHVCFFVPQPWQATLQDLSVLAQKTFITQRLLTHWGPWEYPPNVYVVTMGSVPSYEKFISINQE